LKAIRLYETLGNQRVVLEEVPRPQIGAGEVLVRVHATAVTPGEPGWYPTLHTQNGDPRSQAILSHEFSGVIEEIAPDVAALAEGDAVYGLNNWFTDGAAAEYCVTTPSEMAPKPQTIDHLQTAVTPISGLTAWQALFDHGKLEAGQKVLIHGGAGGVGSFAIQLAAWKGALVITTVSESNAEFVHSLGAQGNTSLTTGRIFPSSISFANATSCSRSVSTIKKASLDVGSWLPSIFDATVTTRPPF
jgi:NADPH:quinone reductase-like Zn-dependent oxidoreductase